MVNENFTKPTLSEPSNDQPRIVLARKGDTITLKQLIPTDAELYFNLVSFDRKHLSQHGDETAKKYQTVEDVRNSILYPNPVVKKYRFGIWDGDKMVGSNNLTIDEDGRAESGSWVGKEYTGHNYAARGRELLLDFAFNQLHLPEVYSEIVIGNDPSRKSVESSGYSFVGEKNGKWIYVIKNPQKTTSE